METVDRNEIFTELLPFVNYPHRTASHAADGCAAYRLTLRIPPESFNNVRLQFGHELNFCGIQAVGEDEHDFRFCARRLSRRHEMMGFLSKNVVNDETQEAKKQPQVIILPHAEAGLYSATNLFGW